MPYKDKEKQKQANRERQRRYRAKQDVTPENNAQAVTPDNYGGPDCACLHCCANRRTGSKFIINHGPYKPFTQLAFNEVNRVSLPDDVDYDGIVGVSLPAIQ